jgi:hypothetical protein
MSLDDIYRHFQLSPAKALLHVVLWMAITDSSGRIRGHRQRKAQRWKRRRLTGAIFQASEK